MMTANGTFIHLSLPFAVVIDYNDMVTFLWLYFSTKMTLPAVISMKEMH